MGDNKSVDRILRILELISKHPEGLTLSEIYKELNIPKSTVFDFLQALYKADAIYFKDEVSKRYVIGSKIYALGQPYTKNSSLITVCRPILRTLGNKYGNLLFVTKRINDDIVYVHKYENDDSKIATFDIGGSISYMHTSSVGKCYLAFDKYFNSYTVKSLDRFTPYTIIRNEDLLRELNTARELGYSSDDREEDIRYKSLSFPIYNFENRCCGVLTYKCPADFEIDKELIDAFIKASKTISNKLGYKI